MKTQIQIDCPDCHSPSFSIHGKKSYGKQNYQCKDCKRQFIGDHALTYNGCHSRIEDKIRLMTVRGCGVRDIAIIASVSIGKVLSTIGSSVYKIVAYFWGKRDLKTAQKLRARLKQLKVSYGSISMDNWDSFITAFKPDNKQVGKQHTVGIEGNNCRLRHRLRRAVRKTCCFSKKFDNHFKVFDLVFFYVNYGYV